MREDIEYEKGTYTRFRLLAWRDYLRETEFTEYRHRKKLCPYKWWQFQYLFEVPAFYLVQLLFSKNSRLKALNPIHIAAKIAIVVVETIFVYLFTKCVLDKIF
jgi:hypothetical protein